MPRTLLFLLCLAAFPVFAADERDAEAAKQAALGERADLQESQRPSKLPDLLKGETIPVNPKTGPITWNMGPTGIIGIKNGGFAGDQVRVVSVLPGSPASGKILPGDVVLGVQGNDFVVGGHLGLAVGNAIIQAEEEAGKGGLRLHIWRDRNWTIRNSAQDVTGVDIDKLFKEAEDDADLFDWKDAEEKEVAVTQAGYDKYPLDGVHTNIHLALKVMGTYSDTSPWDCPVVAQIREDAWKVLEARFKPDKRRRVPANWLDAIALVASGKPEHRKLVYDWVRTQKLTQDMDAEIELKRWHYGSWHTGFNPLEMAIYYDATGDDYVLPQIRYHALWAALAQNGGGSWGHSFPAPSNQGGRLHMYNTGYGAMNNAGTRCFFLLTLAQKFGIKHPEIDQAIERASRFFGTYVDKGCIPYGYHAPYGSDDSNGKNYGATYAFHVLGKTHEAKYYSMHSNHASFTRRGGHGSPTLWYYTPLSANISGPRGVQASMRNMRWFYTLARRHDGSFVMQGEQAGIGGKPSRSPTATHALHYSAPLKQLVITGKDPDPSEWLSDEELEELLVSARGTRDRGQLTEPRLLEQVGTPWNERDTAELVEMLDHFYPNMRRAIAKELAKRKEAGQKEIVAKVLPLLKHEEARMRDGACHTLSGCGTDSVLQNLSKITELLNDPAEFVRMTAVTTIAKATGAADPNQQRMFLQAATWDYQNMSMDNANLRTSVRDALFPGGRRGSGESASTLSTDPFKAGFDEALVRSALERIITLDPGGIVPRDWSKETLLKLAGPIVHVADEFQLNDAMFGGARTEQGRALLAKHGYREATEGDVSNLLKRHALERTMRRRVQFKRPYITPKLVKKSPGRYHEFLDPLNLWLQDDPVAVLSESRGKGIPPIITPLEELIDIIGSDLLKQTLPSIAPEAEQLFRRELEKTAGTGARLKVCRTELADPGRKNTFRKMAAMTFLAETLGADAIDDLAPYLGHEDRRIRAHTHHLCLDLAKSGAEARLIERLSAAEGVNAAGMLAVLAENGSKTAIAPARQALAHRDPEVRQAAVEALFSLAGTDALPDVLAFMKQATDREDLWGCERALLSRVDDAAFKTKLRQELTGMLPQGTPEVRGSIAWILAQLGDAESLATLVEAATTTKDETDLAEIVTALSYSPDRAADQAMLALAKVDKTRREQVASQSVRRMVGRNGIGDVTDTQRLDFAVPMLRMKHDPRLISYLGKVHTGRSARILHEVLKTGSTEVASEAIIACAEGMNHPPASDGKPAADALKDVIEFIEVTQLRGGVGGKDWRSYPKWKTLQARAGKALLKVYKPSKAPIPAFDDFDLDL